MALVRNYKRLPVLPHLAPFNEKGFTHTDYLETFADNPGDVYSTSAIDPAMKNAFTQTRKWIMAKYDLSEYEAWTIITQAVNFGMTQLVDGNWGVHAIIPKSVFEGVERDAACCEPESQGGGSNSEGGSATENWLTAPLSLLTVSALIAALL